MKNELRDLLKEMQVPTGRLELKKQDIAWLGRNLAIRNRGHKNFKRAVEILAQLRDNGMMLLDENFKCI